MEKNSFEQEVINCLEHLRKGDLVQFPTDTGWVLACDASVDLAVKRLKDELNNLSRNLTILVADERELLKHVSSLDLEVFNFLEKQQFPVSVLFDGILGVSEEALNPDNMAAFRVVKEDFSRHLLKRFRKPVAAIQSGSEKIPVSGYKVNGLPVEIQFVEQQLVKWSAKEVTIL